MNRIFLLRPLIVFVTLATQTAVYAGNTPSVVADTTQPKRPSQSVSSQATAPMILPGTRLDTNFNTLPAQNPAVGKAAPAWLRAKTTGTPIYVIDGKLATVKQLRGLRQSAIASVNRLNGHKATILYGKNARNGMILITTKTGTLPRRP